MVPTQPVLLRRVLSEIGNETCTIRLLQIWQHGDYHTTSAVTFASPFIRPQVGHVACHCLASLCASATVGSLTKYCVYGSSSTTRMLGVANESLE
jgi:hypothetical protein